MLNIDWHCLEAEIGEPNSNNDWWSYCYVPHPAENTLRYAVRSIIVLGQAKSGKSVLLKALKNDSNCLTINYPIDYWPHERNVWSSDYNHLGQIMARATVRLAELFTTDPDSFLTLSEISLEFWRWMLGKYGDRRALTRFLNGLPRSSEYQPFMEILRYLPFEDFYPTDTRPADVQGQLEELITLVQQLGFQGVTILVDTGNEDLTVAIRQENVKNLFGWLKPLQIKNFYIKAAFSKLMAEKINLNQLTRGRVDYVTLQWTEAQCIEIVHRHLAAATHNSLTQLSQLATPSLINRLKKDIPHLNNAPLPQYWLWATTAMLKVYQTQKYQLPLDVNAITNVLITYYKNYVPLRLETGKQGVWRGETFIPLADQPYIFLETLWNIPMGTYANDALLNRMGSPENINTVASRIRKAIEPIRGTSIYLKNTRSEGYWLENITKYKNLTG